MPCLHFDHPEPVRVRQRILPVFLPFHGCPHRCLYCAQHLQTGVGTPGLDEILARMTEELNHHAVKNSSPLGVAFYGGTFTALSNAWQKRFLETVRPFRESGLVTHIRCSTRPDRIHRDHGEWLRSLGLDMVELGIQSFDPDVLQATGRGYDPATAVQACERVRAAGLQLGIQLMPGLPMSTPGNWFQDVRISCSLRPDAVRIYPCMVMRNTPLALSYQRGIFQPWSLPVAIWAVSKGLLQFWEHAIQVIRIGLAPEQELSRALVAGPWHPALGHLAKSHALRTFILRRLAALPGPQRWISVPRRCASEFWGHQREHAATWIRHGLPRSRVQTWDRPYFRLHALQTSSNPARSGIIPDQCLDSPCASL